MCVRQNRFLVTLALAVAGLFLAALPSDAQSNYVVRPGDTLQVEVLEDSGLNRVALVLPDGSINFPMAGTVVAKGKTLDQVSSSLSSALAPNFAAPPNVYVSIASLAQTAPTTPDPTAGLIDVFAVGQVQAPGRIGVKRGTTLLQFIAQAGGLTRFAAEKRIELLRTDPRSGKITTYLFNFRTPAGGEKGINGGTQLAPGDVVKVPQRRLFE